MRIQEILQNIPQRYPFILVDKVLEIEPRKRLVAIKNVSINEPYFVGHFPGNPVMPGVLILEALAQACIILAKASVGDDDEQRKKLHVFAGIDKARFKQLVLPGDQLHLHVQFLKARKDVWLMEGKAYVEGNIVCSAELLSASKG